LRLPSRLAPVQVVVLLVRDEDGAGLAAAALVDGLRRAGHRVHLDDRLETTFGRRSVDWELKGVPVRVEVGPRELRGGQVTLVRRDLQEKRAVSLGALEEEVAAALERVQETLYAEAAARQAEATKRVKTLVEAAEVAAEGFAVLPWDSLGETGEAELAAQGFSVRCLQGPGGALAEGEDESGLVAVVARAY
jgi:prolyl-tRNA synthetase